MDLAERVLAGSAPGQLTAVVGRPGSGVSRLLSDVVSAVGSSDDEPRPVLASWERPPPDPSGEPVPGRVVAPEIINWDVDELRRCRELADAPEGTVVAVDYLQLVGPANDAAEGLEALASQRGWRMVLGVMATRDLAGLERSLCGEPAIAAVEEVFPRILGRAGSVVVLTSGPPHRATLAGRTSTGRWSNVTTVPR